MVETKKLFKLVQKYTGVDFVLPSIKEITEDDVEKDYIPKRISKNNRFFQPDGPLVSYR